MQLFLKMLDGQTHTCNVPEEATVMCLKQALREKTGIPTDQPKIIFSGRQLLNEEALQNHGVRNDCVLHVVLRLRGGACVMGFDFATLRHGTETVFNDTAPAYRVIGHGFNLEGKCENAECEASGKRVWSKIGFKHAANAQGRTDDLVGFNIGSVIHKAPCPLCHQFLDSESIVSCGFYKCEYKYEGYAKGEKEAIKGGNRVANDGAFEYHDGIANAQHWTHLVIEVKPL